MAKCDRIFYYLLEKNQIKLSQGRVIPTLEELKRWVYCMWHNSYSHATNHCNVFCRKIQLAIDEGWLTFTKMQVDELPFPIRTIGLLKDKTTLKTSKLRGGGQYDKSKIPKDEQPRKSSYLPSKVGDKRERTTDDNLLLLLHGISVGMHHGASMVHGWCPLIYCIIIHYGHCHKDRFLIINRVLLIGGWEKRIGYKGINTKKCRGKSGGQIKTKHNLNKTGPLVVFLYHHEHICLRGMSCRY